MSITLDTPTLVQVNGETIENDTDGASTIKSTDYLANSISFTLRTGALLDGNLNAGNYGPSANVTINLTTGDWSSVDQANVTTTGTMLPADLANMIAQITALRNSMEAFACGDSGIMPGVQVPW